MHPLPPLPVVDLHCDLLCYLSRHAERTPFDPAARCAIPQLHAGKVQLQILAIFTETTPCSVEEGLHQAHLYQQLSLRHPHHFRSYEGTWTPPLLSTLLAFENASGFCDEDEPVQRGCQRLEKVVQTIAKPLYVSLTWNTENRFGGGAFAPSIGLKEEGKLLLEELDRLHIAVDLSHASDPLAYDILDYATQRGLTFPILASHSNARVMAAAPRNLPDEIAREILRRNGLIGLNLCRHFVGASPDAFIQHIVHWMELGGENQIAFGADFFYDADLSSAQRYGPELFFADYQDASCYPALLDLLQRELKWNKKQLSKLAYENALTFINNTKIIAL